MATRRFFDKRRERVCPGVWGGKIEEGTMDGGWGLGPELVEGRGSWGVRKQIRCQVSQGAWGAAVLRAGALSIFFPGWEAKLY